MSMLKQWRSLLIKLTGSALILWLLFRFVDIDLKALGKQLEHLNLLKYLISLSGVILVLAVKVIAGTYSYGPKVFFIPSDIRLERIWLAIPLVLSPLDA